MRSIALNVIATVALASLCAPCTASDRLQDHAQKSFAAWREGNVTSALDEGQAAVKAAPRNLIALTNLAAMSEGLDDCNAAIPLYQRAAQIDPAWWLPQVGLARSYEKVGKHDEALRVLSKMTQSQNRDCNWYSEAADVYVQMQKPQEAMPVAARAVQLARTPEQILQAKSLYLLACLRAGDAESARKVYSDTLALLPADYELYARCVALPALSHEQRQHIVDLGKTALKEVADAEGFFRIGRVLLAQGDAIVAADALENAVKLNPMMPQYRTLLAGAYLAVKKTHDATQQLQAVQAINKEDVLSGLVLRYVDSSNASPLTKVLFQAEGLNCGCHASKLTRALGQVKGVAFADMASVQPYKGSLLVDSAVAGEIESIFAQGKTAAATTMHVPIEKVTFKVMSSEPSRNTVDALLTAQQATFGDPLQFTSQFKAVQPMSPETKIAALHI